MYSYKRNTITKTSIRCNESQPGERIEEKIERLLNNKEPIRDTAPQVFTDRQDGVKPEYDIRTDKWEEAASAADKVAEARLAIRNTKADQKVVRLDPKTGKKAEDQSLPNPENPAGGEVK